MFEPSRQFLKPIGNEIAYNAQYVSEYISSPTAFTDAEDDERYAQEYIALVKNAKSALELLIMQEQALLDVAKQNTKKYHDSLNLSPRKACIQIDKEKYYGRTKLRLHLRVSNVDGIQIEDAYQYIDWKERGLKNKFVEEFINIAVEKHGVIGDIPINDNSKNK